MKGPFEAAYLVSSSAISVTGSSDFSVAKQVSLQCVYEQGGPT